LEVACGDGDGKAAHAAKNPNQPEDDESCQQSAEEHTAGGGLLVGALLAAFIIFGLVRVLGRVSRFADAIAKGDFQAQVDSRERGEIGHMLTAMRQIPAVLTRLVEQANMLAFDIMTGKLRQRLDTGAFSGSYSELIKAVNTVGDAYTVVIDDMGIPMMCCDKGKQILYLSKAAQQVVGNCLGKQCAAELRANHCEKGCFGERAMAQNAPVADETTIRPGNKTIEVNVSACPMHNPKGEVVGFMEVLTDLTQMKTQQATMLRVAQEAGEIANRVAAATEELSAQVEEVSRGAEEQRSRVESTATAMTEMNSNVLEVARNAGRASEQAETTRSKANDGAALVDKVVHSINLVNKVASTLQTNMQELGAQAESIGGVMNVISDIADQTNLLALNAAIEAARAGDAGRGFAVVADEVRKLAEKTMTATQEVGANITAIQNSARTNINEVGAAAKAVTEATELANTSGQALTEIVELASVNSSVVTSIATAAEEQSATSEEINQSIAEISKIVTDTADGMTQASAAVQELSQMAQKLNKVMGELK
jgi:methyl-accepting chemotaxis protein